MKRLHLSFAALLLLLALGAGWGTLTAEEDHLRANDAPVPQAPSPFIDEGKKGVRLNTFSLALGAFPLSGRFDELPGPPDHLLIPKEELRALLDPLFAARGLELRRYYAFNYTPIHVRLDGYDARRHVGYILIGKEDYERPIPDPQHPGEMMADPSPDKISVVELMALEHLNAQERCYVALINVHQFAYKPEEGEAGKQKRIEKLTARTQLYLDWAQARSAARSGQKPPSKP